MTLARYSIRTLAAALPMAALLAAGPVVAQKLVFMTGPAGGTWYPLGGAVKQILEQEIDGLAVTVRPGAGLINIKGISSGKADIAWGNVISTVDALAGRAPFKDKVGDLCNIAALYQQYAQVPVTDLSITSFADLRGKSVATLPRGNTTEAATRTLLSLWGLTYDDLGQINFASITDQVNMMKDGQIVGMILISSVPAGGVLDLATARDTRLLEISDDAFAKLKAINPGWARATIPAGTYSGQDEDVATASFRMHMMANCSQVSDDLAYAITKALAERGGELSAVTAMLEGYDVEAMAVDVGVPLHPGAERYYREAGTR
ncbi:MAG: TAXI family TRAP transporter solute-binding subunit [Alphaproteobacteria bacterium]|jgi:hypothetical protein|nr:TAXI family TRAP transporter solute-binding subunit [Alphaproteobacteria bacterium]